MYVLQGPDRTCLMLAVADRVYTASRATAVLQLPNCYVFQFLRISYAWHLL
jgi:hypothetical protein